MGKVDLFSISLLKQFPIYYSGEAITGTLQVKVKEKMKIKSIQILLGGLARVYWKQYHGSGKRRRKEKCKASKSCLSSSVVLLAKQGDDDLYMEVGDYTYPFSVALPQNLPTSFESPIGRIRYTIKGKIDIPWAIDKYTIKSFSVINHYDLNSSPILRQPVNLNEQKVLGFLCCKSDPITADFTLLKTGYVAGEILVFNAAIDNKTSKEIKEMSMTITQKSVFTGHYKEHKRTKVLRGTISVIKYPKAIAPLTKETWNKSYIVIPPICPTISTDLCSIINLSYSAVFKFSVDGFSLSTEMKIPIQIGTIPIFINGTNNIAGTIRYESTAPDSHPSEINEESQTDGERLESDGERLESDGETLESDEKTFRPIYPYYKN